MHGSGPKLIIVAKKEMMGDEMPNFDGDSYVEAKKKMMNSGKDEERGGHSNYPDDPHAAMKQMADEMYKASKHHAGLADKLIELCEEMYEKEKGPHKAAGHNPHGKAKSMY